MLDRVKTIENQVKQVRVSANDWQARLRPARKAQDDAERAHLELQAQRRQLRAELEGMGDDASDMAYLTSKAKLERLEGRIAKAGDERARTRATLERLEAEWHADIARRRSDVVASWRAFAYEQEKALRDELLALG